jgi:hypothetical protein
MTKTCSIDRLIQTTRQQWESAEAHVVLNALGSAMRPLTIPKHSTAACGLQSAHDFTGMGNWSTSDDNTDDTLLAAA